MSRCRTFLPALLVVMAAELLSHQLAGFSAEITAERSDQGVVVKIDGRLFAEYRTRSGTKPILWPIIGPTGKPMTRDFPMSDQTGEATDHPHHRSMWFSHGDVNGINFWLEQGEVGTIKHVEFTKIAGGKTAVISTGNDWLSPNGKKVCEDRRTLHFDTDGNARWIDFDIDIKASEGPLRFGDTKEGTFGVRVAESHQRRCPSGGPNRQRAASD